jgi:hypothetical protein
MNFQMHDMRRSWSINKIINYLLAVLLVLAICNQLYALYLHKTFTKEEIDAFFEPITSKYGLRIVYEVDDDFLSFLEKSPITEPIRHRVLVRNVDILQMALERYPVQVIKDHLCVINFAGNITGKNGSTYGGLYDELKKSIYLTDHGSQPHDHVIRTFHHEFSSLLLKRNSFDINQWTDNNPKDFEYSFFTTKDLTKTFKSASAVGTEADYEKGFMDTYGQTSVENDVNEYAAMIFTYPQKFKKIMNQYPRVRGKFLVLLEFYHNIDPIFTEEYLLGSK